MWNYLAKLLLFFEAICFPNIVCSPDPHNWTAKYLKADEYFQHGQLLLNNSKVDDSLPFFRAAVRLCSLCDGNCINCQKFLASLICVEFDLGIKNNLLRLLNIMSSIDLKPYDELNCNINKSEIELEKSSNESCEEGEGDDTCEKSIQLRSIANLYPHDILIPCGNIFCFEFENDEIIKSKPFIIPNGLKNIGFDFQKLTNSLLNQNNSHVDFYPQNIKEKPYKIYNVPLKEALEYLYFPDGAYVNVDASEPGTYIQFNADNQIWNEFIKEGYIANNMSMHLFNSWKHYLITSLNINDTIDNEYLMNTFENVAHQLHWNMILIGESNAGMFLHQDRVPVASWQLQLEGSKMWLICPPEVINDDNYDCYNNYYESNDISIESYKKGKIDPQMFDEYSTTYECSRIFGNYYYY